MRRGHHRGDRAVGRIVFQFVEPDLGPLRDQVEIDRMVDETDVEHTFDIFFDARSLGHCSTLKYHPESAGILAIAPRGRPGGAAMLREQLWPMSYPKPRASEFAGKCDAFATVSRANPRRAWLCLESAG
jgi:hypothetical protein